MLFDVRAARFPYALSAAAVLTALLAGCAAPADMPAPERTIAATQPGVAPVFGDRRIAVVSADAGADGIALAAVRRFAAQSGATLSEYVAAEPDDAGIADALDHAVAADADLIVGIGPAVVDVFSFETAQLLQHQFLILGAQLAEPTENVTAVIWAGATSRGSAASADGPVAGRGMTAARAAAALDAGVASILDGVTGVVLLLPDE
jgi:hypothetical protein